MAVKKEIPFEDGSSDQITLTANKWQGNETVDVEVPENFGPFRSKTLVFYSAETSKTANSVVAQSEYTIEVLTSSLQWQADQTTGLTLLIKTNGTRLANFSATLQGQNADKFALSAPVLTDTAGVYAIQVTPVGTNETEDDYTAIVHCAAGTRQFWTADIALQQDGIRVVSTDYEDFVGEWDISGRIYASGGAPTFRLNGVTATRVETMSNGTVRRTTGVPRPYQGGAWRANFTIGVPVRATISGAQSDHDYDYTWFDLDIPSLGTTIYSPIEQTVTITLWPADKDSSVSQPHTYALGPYAQIEANARTYNDDITLLNSPFTETDADGAYVIPYGAQSLTLYIGAKRTTTYTSGVKETADVPVYGDGSDSGIQDITIPDTYIASGEDGYPTEDKDWKTGWCTATLTWGESYLGRTATVVRIVFNHDNQYYIRTFKGKWKTI